MNIDSPGDVESEYCPDPQLNAAIEYALASPGKRLRSQLTVETARMAAPDAVAAAAAVGDAIELLHTYSLIHDDLPAMDNDDLRRGRPTVHRAFNEATAILLGDGLQALAFERIAAIEDLGSDQRLSVISAVSRAVGFHGMVGGQAMDLAAEGATLTDEQLGRIHRLKTGALIAAAVDAGAICAAVDREGRAVLSGFAQKIGLAFQVVDDILDATANQDTLGKTPGKDFTAGKSTYVSQLGVEGAQLQAKQLLTEATDALCRWGERAQPLRELAIKMVERSH